MRTGFIGAGKVGFSLGKFFSEGGIHVTGYYSRHIESAKEAAAFTGTKSYEKPGELIQDSDALFLTVPDGVISEVFEELKKYNLRGKQICHCSGSMTAGEVFPGIEQTGAAGFSIHPLFPVSDKYHAYRELTDAFFCLEGAESCLEEWKERLEALGPTVQIISPEVKVRYHAACAVASNLVCALVQESLDLLVSCGFAREQALTALAPLMRSNMEHLIAGGPVEALTGPVERNDVGTVQKHISCFSDRDERKLYCAVSEKLITIAQQKHPETDFSEMKEILREGF